MNKFAIVLLLFALIVIFSIGDETVIINGKEQNASVIVSSPDIKTGLYEGQFTRDLFRSSMNTCIYNWGVRYGRLVSFFNEEKGNNIKIKAIGKRYPKPSYPTSGWMLGNILGYIIFFIILTGIAGSLDEEDKNPEIKTENNNESISEQYKRYKEENRGKGTPVKTAIEKRETALERLDKKIALANSHINLLNESFSSGLINKKEHDEKLKKIHEELKKLNSRKQLRKEKEENKLLERLAIETILTDLDKLNKLRKVGLLTEEELWFKKRSLIDKTKEKLKTEQPKFKTEQQEPLEIDEKEMEQASSSDVYLIIFVALFIFFVLIFFGSK